MVKIHQWLNQIYLPQIIPEPSSFQGYFGWKNGSILLTHISFNEEKIFLVSCKRGLSNYLTSFWSQSWWKSSIFHHSTVISGVCLMNQSNATYSFLKNPDTNFPRLKYSSTSSTQSN